MLFATPSIVANYSSFMLAASTYSTCFESTCRLPFARTMSRSLQRSQVPRLPKVGSRPADNKARPTRLRNLRQVRCSTMFGALPPHAPTGIRRVQWIAPRVPGPHRMRRLEIARRSPPDASRVTLCPRWRRLDQPRQASLRTCRRTNAADGCVRRTSCRHSQPARYLQTSSGPRLPCPPIAALRRSYDPKPTGPRMGTNDRTSEQTGPNPRSGATIVG